MTTLYKYQFYCETEETQVSSWAEEAPTTCPNGSGHSIDQDSIEIVDQLNTDALPIKAKNFISNEYQDLELDAMRNLKINVEGPLTGFGNIAVETPYPTIQIDGLYGILNTDVIPTEKNGASVLEDPPHFEVSCGVSGGYGDIQSLRRHKYRPGQGTVGMFTARFDAGVTGAELLAGLTTEFSGIYFGYDTDADFGILHENDGMFHVDRLTMTAGVTSGNSTMNLTLHGDEYTIPLTAMKSAEYNCWEIQEYFKDITNWLVHQNEKTVTFTSDYSTHRDGDLISSHGTLTEILPGRKKTKNWVKQANWNYDTMDGTGPSGMTLDPSKGNVYKINVQWLGYGNTALYIENQDTGKFTLVHVLKWANQNIDTVYENPSFKPKISANSKTNTVSGKVITPCMTLFNEGPTVYRRNTRSFSVTKIGIAQDITALMTLRNRHYFKGNINTSEIIPKFISLSNISAQHTNTTIYLVVSHDFTDYQNFKYVNEKNSIAEFSIDSNEVSHTDIKDTISTYNLGNENSYTINLESISIEPMNTLTIFARTNKKTSEISASITWVED